MSKVICNLAISLDGFIAKLDGNVDFLGNEFTEEQAKSFQTFLDDIDVIVMGRTSYERMMDLGGNTFKDKKVYVLTSKEYTNQDNVLFIDADVIDL